MDTKQKPNIVMILVDQMAADCIRTLGHSTVITPSLDRIAGSGAVFTNAYCNSPLCAPSRACLASGLLVRNNGVYDNAAEFSAEIPTLMHHIVKAGYETIGVGKFHFAGPDQLHGFNARLTTDIFPSDFGWTPDWSQGPTPSATVSIETVKNARIVTSNKYLDYDEEVLFRTLESIRQLGRRKEAAPFFLNTSFTHPHPPFEVLERYYSLYKDDVDIPQEMELTPSPNAYDRWIRILNRLDEIPISEKEIRHARRCYYGMVSYIDDLVGKIVEELRLMNLLKDTILIFSSDHGELLGEHGLWFKRTYYEQAIRVPLLVSWPGSIRPGLRIERLVSLVDLTATLMDVASVEEKDYWLGQIDGDSFAHLLTDPTGDWKDEVIFEYYGKGTVAPMCGIRRGALKYVFVGGGEYPEDGEHPKDGESALFDLDEDPYENSNLIEDARYRQRLADLRNTLFRDYSAEEIERRILQSQRRRLLIREVMRKGKRRSWDHQPFFDASEQYVR